MGINAQVKRGDCKGQNRKETHTESIASWAQKSNKSAGLVTTSRVTHASPGGLYAREYIIYLAHMQFVLVASTKHLNFTVKQILPIAIGKMIKR